MDNKFQRLEDLAELYKSNAITKEEFEILKSELLSSDEKDPKIDSSVNQKEEIRIDSSIRKNPSSGFRKPQKPKPHSALVQKNNDKAWGRVIFCVILVAIFIGVKFYGKNSSNDVPVTNTPLYNNSSPDNNTVDNTNPNDRLTNIVMGKISNREFTYINNENGLITTLKFEPSAEGAPVGSLSLSQSGGHIVYTYQINGTSIDIKFYGSDCGKTGADQTLKYDESNNCIYSIFDGQQLAFKGE